MASYIAQQVQAKRLGFSPLGGEAAEYKASMSVLMAEPDLRKEDLGVISSKLDRANGIETVSLSSPESEYVVSIKRMKSGHSIVSYEKLREATRSYEESNLRESAIREKAGNLR